MLGLDGDPNLVRGVSNHGAAPSFETGATRCWRLSKARGLAPSSGRGG